MTDAGQTWDSASWRWRGVNGGPNLDPCHVTAGATIALRVGTTSSNGRAERTQDEPTDLNVPLALECEVVGMAQWLELVR